MFEDLAATFFFALWAGAPADCGTQLPECDFMAIFYIVTEKLGCRI